MADSQESPDSQASPPPLCRSPIATPAPTPSRLPPIVAPAPPPSRCSPVTARAVPVRNGSRTVVRRSPPQPSPDGFPHVAGPQATRAISGPQPSTMSPDPPLIRTAEAAHTVLMDTSPSDEGLSGGSPSARTPIVEVLMPMPSSTTAKCAIVSRTESQRIDQENRARSVVGSPTLRIINQIQMSTQRRSSPRSITTQKSRGTRSRNTSWQLRSVHWKEFEPIIEDGEIVCAKCVHCHDYLSGRQGIGTSHLKKHLERCKLRAKLTDLIDKLRAGGKPADIDLLDNWVYDSDMPHRALVRMIVLHEFPFSIVEYDGFREFVSSLNPLFKMVSRTTIKLDCMRTFEDAKLELSELFKNSSSRVSLTSDI